MVGDEDQSIYRFREADIRNILDFEKDFPGAKVVRLERNYRSTQPILSAASAVVANNVERKGKRLYTERSGGEPVRFYEASDERGEAAYVVRELLQLREPRASALGSCGDLLPHARAVAAARRGAPQVQPAVRGRGRNALLRPRRGEGRPRLPARAAQSRPTPRACCASSTRPRAGSGAPRIERVLLAAEQAEVTLWEALVRGLGGLPSATRSASPSSSR